MDSFPRG